uniref:Uncharacterized protein n=1 Tax=Aegilops tauschii TaxID=37682 RepID=N1QVD1_AEGTA
MASKDKLKLLGTWVSPWAARLVILWKLAFTANRDEEKTDGIKHMLAGVMTLEGALKERANGKPFFGGASVGYVDTRWSVGVSLGN